MWQTKYASAVPKHLGVGVNFRPCSEGYFFSGSPQSVLSPHLILALQLGLSLPQKGNTYHYYACLFLQDYSMILWQNLSSSSQHDYSSIYLEQSSKIVKIRFLDGYLLSEHKNPIFSWNSFFQWTCKYFVIFENFLFC